MLSPKAVLVTGANRGIGLEFCKQFLKLTSSPKHIFAGCRNPDSAEDLKTLAKSNSALCVLQLDVTDQDSIEKSKAAIESTLCGEGLNLLINSAGFLNRTDLYETTKEGMMKHVEINAVGPLVMVQKAANAQTDNPMSCNKAAIINISTGVASITENSSGKSYTELQRRP